MGLIACRKYQSKTHKYPKRELVLHQDSDAYLPLWIRVHEDGAFGGKDWADFAITIEQARDLGAQLLALAGPAPAPVDRGISGYDFTTTTTTRS